MVPINGSGLTRVALLNDFSCFGKCSLTVSIPIISSYGIETVPLPTAVLSTHTGGFDRFVMRDMTEDMRQIAAHWKEMDMQFDCIYTGFFCTIEQIAFAREFIRTFSGPQTIVLSDPVLGDNGSLYSCFSEDFAAEMRKLCEMADIIMSSCFIIPASLIYRRRKDRKSAVLSMAVGTVLMTIAGVLVNYFILIPAYQTLMNLPLEVIVGMGTKVWSYIDNTVKLVIFITAPFNILKGAVLSVVTYLLYKRVSPLLHQKSAR